MKLKGLKKYSNLELFVEVRENTFSELDLVNLN